MKQSAVEWLVEELQKAEYIPKDSIIMDYVIKLSKEMEKEMLYECWKASEWNMRHQFSSSNYKNLNFGEYYERR
jgi:hypothetical protein